MTNDASLPVRVTTARRIIALTEPIGDRRFFSLLPDIQRDSRQDVTRFLDTVYPGRYRIYDERGVPFPTSSYDARAAAAKRTYSLAVHGCIQSPPSLEEIDSFCKDATAWLRDPANVAVVQCEDGKSQNGVLICCLLLSQGLFKNPEKSLTHFQGKRLKPGRESDDMPPSLSRYVAYYFQLVRVPSTCLKISAPRPVNLREVRAFGLPSAHAAVAVWVRQRGDGFNEQRVYVLASPGCRSAQQFYACGSHTVTYEDKEGVLELQLVPCKATCLIHGNSLSLACRSSPLELDGDFKVQVFTGDFSRRKTHFCAWLNTAFVNTDHGVYLACDELDMPRRGAGAPGLDLFF